MAQRIVFGRRTVVFGGDAFIIEMRSSGIWVRRKYQREKVRVEFDRILKYVIPQLELGLTFDGLDSSNQTATVSTVPKGQLVPDKPEGGDSVVHEGDLAPPQAAEGREPGLDSSLRTRQPATETNQPAAATDNQLPEDN
jgi:hypothetical protein